MRLSLRELCMDFLGKTRTFKHFVYLSLNLQLPSIVTEKSLKEIL